MAESKELTNEVLNTISRSQAAVIDAIEKWATAIRSIAPDMPNIDVPFAEKLPSPQEVVAGAYDFAEQLLAGQRKFAEEVLQATAPLLPGGSAGTEKKAASGKKAGKKGE